VLGFPSVEELSQSFAAELGCCRVRQPPREAGALLSSSSSYGVAEFWLE
jgi:hypothetical protein